MKIEYCQTIRKSDFTDILENFLTAEHIATAKRESLSHNKDSSNARPPFWGKDTRRTSRKKSHESRRYPRPWPLEEPTDDGFL